MGGVVLHTADDYWKLHTIQLVSRHLGRRICHSTGKMISPCFPSGGFTFRKSGWRCVTRFLKPLFYFRPVSNCFGLHTFLRGSSNSWPPSRPKNVCVEGYQIRIKLSMLIKSHFSRKDSIKPNY